MSDCDETPIDDVSRALAEFEQIEKEADAFIEEFDDKFRFLWDVAEKRTPGTQRIEYRYHKSSVKQLRDRMEYRGLHRGAVQ